MPKTKKFFTDVIFYSASNFLANALNLVTGIVIRRLLAPAMMGLFNEIMLVLDYTRYAHLGIIDSLDKELPYFFGRKDYKRLELLKKIGFSLCLGIALCVSLFIFAASLFFKFSGDILLINGVRIVSLMVVLQFMNSFYTVLNRSQNRFSPISTYTILVAALDLITKVVLALRFGLYGILWASVITWILGLIYFYNASKEKIGLVLKFPAAEVVRLFKIGFPIFIMGLVYVTIRNIDRIMIIRLLDRESLGFYTIALMVSVYIVQLPNLIYAVFFPRFYQAYGEKQNIHEIKELFIKPTMVFAYLFPILIGIVVLGLPLLVRYILPAYMPGLIPAYILLLGSSAIALMNMPSYLLIALNKQIYMVFIGVFYIFIGVGLNYMFVKSLNLGLSGIAMGTSLMHFLFSTTLLIYAFRHYTKAFISHIKFFAELYFPFLWVLASLVLLQAFIFRTTGSFLKDFYAVFLKGAGFIILCLPLIIYANKRTAIITILREAYAAKK